MRRALFIPDEVKQSISQHLYTASAEAVAGYFSAHEDEDTLTGDLGATLRISNQRVVVENSEVGGTWTWSLTYYKFRGRGKNANESFLGADGIFEIEVVWNERNRQKKCSLFQAKNQWENKDKSLLEQCIKLSTWREAAFVINYTPINYEAFFIDEVIRASGVRVDVEQAISVGAFLSRFFLECLVGDTDLEYHTRSRKLSWRNFRGERVFTKFSVGHRFALRVTPPKRYSSTKPEGREIPNAKVHEHRMGVAPEELLSVTPDYDEKDIMRARRRLAKTYHTDLSANMDLLYQDILTKRMQDVNNAYDELYSKLKRKTGGDER